MKVGFWPIVTIGIAIALIALSFGYFHHWVPNSEATEAWRLAADEAEKQRDLLPAAKQRREKAIAIVQERADEWMKTVATRTPPLGEVNLGVNGWQLTVEALHYREKLQRRVNAQVKRGGVKVVNGPRIPEPDQVPSAVLTNYFNYPAIPFPVVIFDLGEVEVQGTYEQIMANVRSWSSMPNYLAVADGLTISGTAPILTGRYNVSIVGYLRDKMIYAGVPDNPAAGGAPQGNNTQR